MSLNWDFVETSVQAFYEKRDRRRNHLPLIIQFKVIEWEMEHETKR